MIQSTIGHLQINVHPENLAFYRDLFKFAGWSTLYEDPAIIGVGSETGASLWFCGVSNSSSNDYDGSGMNHLGLAVKQQADVDQMVAYLSNHNVPALFETPRHRPEFSGGDGQTYYQVMFESPDRILFEIVYTGPKDS